MGTFGGTREGILQRFSEEGSLVTKGTRATELVGRQGLPTEGAHLVKRAAHFTFVLKLGSKPFHPKEKYKGILKLQESISSDKIKFQISGKLTYGR